MTILNTSYNPEAWPSKEMQQILNELVGGNQYKLKVLRALIYRAVIPCPRLQTGIWITGLPATGKSTFLNWLRGLLQTGVILTSCSRARLHSARFQNKNCVKRR